MDHRVTYIYVSHSVICGLCTWSHSFAPPEMTMCFYGRHVCAHTPTALTVDNIDYVNIVYIYIIYALTNPSEEYFS